MKRKVFVVSADTDYEGGDVLRVYESEGDAKKYVDKCNAHEKRNPYRTIGVPDDVDELDAFYAKCERWAKRHPAGENNTQRTYTITPVNYWSVVR